MSLERNLSVQEKIKVWALITGNDHLFDLIEGNITIEDYVRDAEASLNSNIVKSLLENEQAEKGRGPISIVPKQFRPAFITQAKKKVEELKETHRKIIDYMEKNGIKARRSE